PQWALEKSRLLSECRRVLIGREPILTGGPTSSASSPRSRLVWPQVPSPHHLEGQCPLLPCPPRISPPAVRGRLLSEMASERWQNPAPESTVPRSGMRQTRGRKERC